MGVIATILFVVSHRIFDKDFKCNECENYNECENFRKVNGLLLANQIIGNMPLIPSTDDDMRLKRKYFSEMLEEQQDKSKKE
jgi:hypothetical protein